MRTSRALLITAIYLCLMPTTIASGTEMKDGPFIIHRIAVDPGNPQVIYAATSNYGILKSSDGGTTWSLNNRGLGSYTHHAVVVNPLHPNIVYVGSWSGGVSKSADRGAQWVGVNDGLGNTAIEDLVLNPTHPEILYAATTAGVFKSPDGGGSWLSYSEGLPVSEIKIFECVFVLPSGPTELFLGTTRGLFKRERSGSAWEEVSGVAKEADVTALALAPKADRLFAGTTKHGLLASRDGGKNWAPLHGGIENTWVSDLAFDPRHPSILYVSTRDNGIFKSEDGGTTWRERNTGLPVKEIRSLAIDPIHPEILYAGTTLDGVFKTRDGGQTWIPLKGYPLLTPTEIIASVSPTDRPRDHAPTLPIPPEFSKCNQCHGWADPVLNMKHTYWRVPPNKRDWTVTVTRMSQRARLTPDEARKIAEFLTAYTQSK